MNTSIELRRGSRKIKEKKEKALVWFLIVADTEYFSICVIHICDKSIPLQICPSYDQCFLYNSHLEREE